MVAIGKKFGQLKQWTGEKLGTAEKTNISEDFKKLDLETESRKDGIEKMTISLTDYAKTLDKRSSQDKKSSALSILAKSMTQQGNFHGEQSKLGLALKRIGEAEDKVDGLQQDFAEKVRKGILLEIMALNTSMKDYTSLKKKLEMRRLDYDAKLNKLNKTKKEKPGLEEEMKTAQRKFNETLQDVEELMSTFAQREELLLGPLIEFAQSQCEYFEKVLENLRNLGNFLLDEKLQETALSQSTVLDKSSLLRRNSSLKTVLPAAISSTELSTIPPPTPELNAIEPPQPISNVSKDTTIERISSGHPPTLDNNDRVFFVEAQYDFSAEVSGEMSIRKGDVIKVTKKIDDGWWQGDCDEKNGLFPANYVKLIDMKKSISRSASPYTGTTKAKPVMATTDRGQRSMASMTQKCGHCGCNEFVANVFKPDKCNNCFHQH